MKEQQQFHHDKFTVLSPLTTYTGGVPLFMLLQTHYFDHTFASTFLSLKPEHLFHKKEKENVDY